MTRSPDSRWFDFCFPAAFVTIFDSMKRLPERVDFIVVGAGVAGLRAAIALAEAGKVLVLAKQELTESATQYAQGGIAVALSDEDEISLHFQDTIAAGDGIVNPEAAHTLVEEGPERIQELIEWGTRFDRNGTRLTFTREAAHSRSRILHAHGDSTGREIGRALHARASSLKNISFSEFEFSSALYLENGRVRGIELISPRGERHFLQSSAVLLATGGAGQVYSNTTNPAVATADGIAMAYRAGAEISDMEFVQFHPTALYVKNAPRFLLSEALRGEGAYLRNMELDRFMHKYHEQHELAPRDVVARAIVHEMERSRSTEPVVYLDLTHLKPDRIRSRFPRIYQTCLQYNIDIGIDLIPVRPAAHYCMGGVRTDLNGRSTLQGLYAAGETACTGVHGANRLASNSLLEGLVFGARAAEAMSAEAGAGPRSACHPQTTERNSATQTEPARQLRAAMWQHAGVIRNKEGLQQLSQQISDWEKSLTQASKREDFETRNLLVVADLVVRSALAREESRGAHFRIDCPRRDDAHFRKHSVVIGSRVSFE